MAPSSSKGKKKNSSGGGSGGRQHHHHHRRRDVDICVTCVSDKPPQLPLREELPSLGIEVVYNARGVGEKAVQDEAKKRQQQREREEQKNKTKDAARKFFSTMKSKKQKDNSNNMADDKNGHKHNQQSSSSSSSKMDPPARSSNSFDNDGDGNGIDIHKALSYGSYQHALEEVARSNDVVDDNDDFGDDEEENYPQPAMTSPSDERMNVDEVLANIAEPGRTSKKKKKDRLPPKDIQFPNTTNDDGDGDIYQKGINDAFRIFTQAFSGSKDGEEGPGNDSDVSSLGGGPETQQQQQSSSPTQKIHMVKIVPSGNMKGEFPDLLASSSSGDTSSAEESDDIESGSDSSNSSRNGSESNNNVGGGTGHKMKMVAGSTSPQNSKDGGNRATGNIHVKLFGQGTSIKEMYDLTELSDVGGTKHSEDDSFSRRLSKSPVVRGVGSAHTITALGHNHHSNFFVNIGQQRHQEAYVLGEECNAVDIPIPQVEDPHGHLVLDLSYVEEEDGPGSPLVYSPRYESDHRDENVHSPTDSPATKHVFGYDQKKKQVLNHMTLSQNQRREEHSEELNREEVRQDGDILQSPTSLAGNTHRDDYYSPFVGEPEGDRHTARLGIANAYRRQEEKPALETDESFDKDETTDLSLPDISLPTNLVSSIRKCASRESAYMYKSPRVSFSRDVEERFFNNTYGGESKPSGPSHRVPLESFSVDDEDITDPLRQKESDVGFRALTEEHGMEEYERSPELMFIEALTHDKPIPFDFEDTIKRNPDLAAERLKEINTFALHAACARNFPDRFQEDQQCHVRDLVDDIMLQQKLVHTLAVACPEACMQVDSKGDLPVHILARQLMQWEARWYQKVYEKARIEEREEENGRGITKLYQTMSESINTLLRPVSNRSDLCLRGGSIGRLLPLHIAAIFTVSYATLKSVIDAHPEAASVTCDLGSIRTFIPDNCTPLELHDRLSTDFPKWEIRRAEFDSKDEVSQEILDQIYGTKGAMRRSDLMFACHPDIMPYRNEKERLNRLETRFRYEMLCQCAETDDFYVDAWMKIFWLFICQYEDESDEADGSYDYVECVASITKSLSVASITFLSRIETHDGKYLIDQSTSKCKSVLFDRLRQAADDEIPVPVCSFQKMKTTGCSIFLRQFEEEMANRCCLRGRGLVGPLCRSLFNVTDGSFPSSFVILPYKLVKDSQGRLGLDSAKAAAIAMKFADSLLQLTSSHSIIQALDRKSSKFTGRGLVADDNDDWWHAQHRLKTEIREFLMLYEDGPGYFYFLDEYTGTPIVNENSFYPLVIREAVDVIRKVLPLMLAGMIIMRGEKAVQIVASTLLDENVDVVHPHWIETAKDLVGYLFSPRTERTASLVDELLPLREKLVAMIEDGPTTPIEIEKDGALAKKIGLTSEWVVETSLVKMIVEMHDPRHTFGGLMPRRSGSNLVWTKERAFLHPDSPEYMMKCDFNSLQQLKTICAKEKKIIRGEQEQIREAAKEQIKQEKEEDHTKYDDLFDDLAIPIPDMDNEDEESDTSDDCTDDNSSTRDKGLPKVITTPTAAQQKSRSFTSSLVQSQSILNFDDDLNLDEVLKIRIQLDEQEAKMEFLREKIQDLADAEDRLLRQEERMQEILDDIFHQRNLPEPQKRKQGLSKARQLLLRICDLEERVLCREVEIGQLNNDITLFKLEAASRMEEQLLLDDDNHRSSMNSSSESSDGQQYPSSDSEEDDDVAQSIVTSSDQDSDYLDGEDLTIDSRE